MRLFPGIVLVLGLVSACGGSTSDTPRTARVESVTTTAVATGSPASDTPAEPEDPGATVPEAATGSTTTSASVSTTEAVATTTSVSATTTSVAATTTTSSADLVVTPEAGRPELDISSSFACIGAALGQQAAFELNQRPATSGEMALIDHCPEPTHDMACVDGALGMQVTDLLLAGRYEPSVEEVERVAGCVLGGTSDQDVAAAGETAAAGGTTTDAPPIDPAAALVDGELVAVELPTPGYEPPDEGGCSVYEGDRCAELRWEPVADLLAGEFTSIQISPADPNVIYAGVDSNDMSLYKSVNAGATWELVHTSGHTSGIAVHPNDPQTVLYTILEGPVQRTNDGGTSWIQVIGKDARSYGFGNRVNPAPEDKLFTAVAFSSDQPDVVYTASHEGDHRTGTERGPVSVYVSDDGGLGWAYAGTCNTCGAIHEFAIRPGDPSEVWVAANNGVQVSRDGGGSWSGNLLPIPAHKFQGTYGVALKPGDPQVILVAGQEMGMFRTDDGGITWASVNDGLTTGRMHKVVFAPSQPNIAYVATHEGIFRSFNAGLTWQQRGEGLPYTFFTSIAVDPSNPDIIYVGTASELVTTHTGHFNDGIHEGEGLYKSTDGGLTWFRSDKGIYEAKAAQLGTHPILPFNLWVDGESGRGAFFTPDAGDTWLFAPFRGSHYPMVFAFTRTFPTVMYVTSWMDDGELMQSVDGGAVWSDITEAVNIGVSDATRSMGLLDENQRRWFHLHGLAVAPSDPKVIYVGSVHDSVYNLQFTLNGAHIFRSTDGGQTFAEASGGFPIDTETSINAIVIHPTDPDTAYAMTSLHETSTAIGIYKTTNGGGSWAPVNNGLDVLTNDLQLDPSDPETLYVATESGVYKTIDGAKSWRVLSIDEPGTPIIDLAIDPLNPLVLYAISPHNLYRTKDGGETWYPASLGLPLLNDGRAFSNYSTSDHRGHRIYGGTFAQDRTLEIDATGRAIYVVAKTQTFDGREENFAAVRHVYRALLEPLWSVTYSFVLGSAVVSVESTSNIYDMVFDQKDGEVRFTAAGPTATSGGSTVTIPGSLLEGPFVVILDGQIVDSTMQGNSVSFSHDHTGRSQVTIRQT